MDEKHFTDLVEKIIDHYELDYGHGRFEVNFADGTSYLVVEAPRHSTITMSLNPIVSYIVEHKLDATPENDKLISGNIKRAIAEILEDYSADEELDYYRDEISISPEGHGMPANFFKVILADCEDFFKETAHNLRQDSKGIPDLSQAE